MFPNRKIEKIHEKIEKLMQEATSQVEIDEHNNDEKQKLE
jgi:hypothetical protein